MCMRCEQHGLVTAPDGLCVLCRRALDEVPPAPVVSSARKNVKPVLVAGLGALLLVVASAMGYRIVRNRQIVAETEVTPGSIAAQARALEDVHVVVYTTHWCPVCTRAKAWLQANGIAYEERDVEASATWASELRARNPAHSIPTFDIEGQVSVGLRPQELLAMRERAAHRRASP